MSTILTGLYCSPVNGVWLHYKIIALQNCISSANLILHTNFYALKYSCIIIQFKPLAFANQRNFVRMKKYYMEYYVILVQKNLSFLACLITFPMNDDATSHTRNSMPMPMQCQQICRWFCCMRDRKCERIKYIMHPKNPNNIDFFPQFL